MTLCDQFLAALHAPAHAPLLMGILNITPNSFSDPRAFLAPDAAAAHAFKLVRDGAALLDLGAEASSFFRPGVAPVPDDLQLARLLPVIEQLTRASDSFLISIDTRSAAVARRCIAAGAHLINDISAGTHDPAMLPACAQLNVPIILMHITPTYPDTPAENDPDIVATVCSYLHSRLAAALDAGIPRSHILLDPGLGFGKTMPDNWTLLARLPDLLALGQPLALGASRKRFLTTLSPSTADLPPHERDLLTALVTARAAAQGAHIHRVHNVALCAQALALTQRLTRPESRSESAH